MSRIPRVLDRSRLGFRGAFLLCLAVLDVVYGWALLHPTAETRQGSAYAWRVEFLPSEVWGACWVAIGVFLVTQAWSRRDRAAYAVAIAMKLVWSTLSFAAWIDGAVPQGWSLGTIFLVVGALTWVASLWSEPILSDTVSIMDLHDDGPAPGRDGDQ